MSTASSDPTVSTRSGLGAFLTGHIGLNVSELDRSRAFYERVFGFDILGESQQDGRRFVFLAKEGKLVLTLWEQAEGRFDAGRPGLHHLSFQVESIDQVRAAERTLRELGAAFAHDGIVPHAEGADSGGIFFEDPDGIRLEIYAPTGAAGNPAPTSGAPTCGFF
ncbi:MAG: VOC family protein [Chloroflexi bacterium]|nr:VOC family protein [Chloroflexota bacterium]